MSERRRSLPPQSDTEVRAIMESADNLTIFNSTILAHQLRWNDYAILPADRRVIAGIATERFWLGPRHWLGTLTLNRDIEGVCHASGISPVASHLPDDSSHAEFTPSSAIIRRFDLLGHASLTAEQQSELEIEERRLLQWVFRTHPQLREMLKDAGISRAQVKGARFMVATAPPTCL